MKVKKLIIEKNIKLSKKSYSVGCSLRTEIDMEEGESISEVNDKVNIELDYVIHSDLETFLKEIQ